MIAAVTQNGMPARKRLNHRGPLSIDVSSAWYFITVCAAERCDYGRAVSTKPPDSAASSTPPYQWTPMEGQCGADVGRAVSTKPPSTPFMTFAMEILDAARFRHVRGKWRLALFLIMPDHIHFIANFPDVGSDTAVSSKPPYRGMEYVIADFKRWLSTKHGLRFQRDFFDTRLRDDAHFAEEYDYILGNPVRKGLCAAPSDWQYSLAFSRTDGGVIDAALPFVGGRAVSTKPPPVGSCVPPGRCKGNDATWKER